MPMDLPVVGALRCRARDADFRSTGEGKDARKEKGRRKYGTYFRCGNCVKKTPRKAHVDREWRTTLLMEGSKER